MQWLNVISTANCQNFVCIRVTKIKDISGIKAGKKKHKNLVQWPSGCFTYVSVRNNKEKNTRKSGLLNLTK